MGSRLGHDGRGKLIVVMTTPALELPVGLRLRVVGNSFAAGGKGIGFLGAPSGRTPEPVEQQTRPAGRTGGVRHSWPADYPERARELHAGGLSCPKVAEELGVAFGTAKSWLWPESQSWERRKQQPHRQGVA